MLILLTLIYCRMFDYCTFEASRVFVKNIQKTRRHYCLCNYATLVYRNYEKLVEFIEMLVFIERFQVSSIFTIVQREPFIFCCEIFVVDFRMFFDILQLRLKV